MIKISTEIYAKSCVHSVTMNERDGKKVVWLKVMDIKDNIRVENMSDLTIKAIKGK